MFASPMLRYVCSDVLRVRRVPPLGCCAESAEGLNVVKPHGSSKYSISPFVYNIYMFLRYIQTTIHVCIHTYMYRNIHIQICQGAWHVGLLVFHCASDFVPMPHI